VAVATWICDGCGRYLTGMRDGWSGDAVGRGRIDVVGWPGVAPSVASGTEVAELGHALAVGALDGLDGRFEDVDQGEQKPLWPRLTLSRQQRIPHAKKYAKEVFGLFQQTRG
jgi:hypothetical protein